MNEEHKDFNCKRQKCSLCDNNYTEEVCFTYGLVDNRMCMVSWSSDNIKFFSAEE